MSRTLNTLVMASLYSLLNFDTDFYYFLRGFVFVFVEDLFDDKPVLFLYGHLVELEVLFL